MASIEDVLSRGYLPKELPFGFSSASFGRVIAAGPPAAYRAGGSARKSVTHSLARPGMLVRTLTMPDPVHFYRLAEVITSEWARIGSLISTSPFSLGPPRDDPKGVRAWIPPDSQRRADARAEHGARARYRVSADVSQFYPSIYTHALDWAIRGKEVAKATPATSGLGPLLDIHTRRGQDRQSVGIPIGPDTSLVLAELVLARVDEEVMAVMRSGVHGFRFFDDYELFTPSRTLADKAIARLSSAMATWQLTLNPYKLTIEELPVPVEDEWVSVLKRVRLGDNSSSQRSDLNALFDEAARLGKKYPKDGVMAYALGQVITRDNELRQRIHRQNWGHLLNLLLQAALGEPGLLPRIGILAQWARGRGWSVPRKGVGAALNLLVRNAASRGHASEVAWGVWLATRLDMPIHARTALAVAGLEDDVVAIVGLDARAQGIIGSLDVSNWAPLMTGDSLSGEHWLLAYEAQIHGWLPSADGTDYISSDPAFQYLRSNDVRFYDEAIDLPSPIIRPSRVRPGGTPVQYAGGAMVDDELPEPPLYDG